MVNKVWLGLVMVSPSRLMQDAFNFEIQREEEYVTEALVKSGRDNVN